MSAIVFSHHSDGCSILAETAAVAAPGLLLASFFHLKQFSVTFFPSLRIKGERISSLAFKGIYVFEFAGFLQDFSCAVLLPFQFYMTHAGECQKESGGHVFAFIILTNMIVWSFSSIKYSS